MQCFQDCSWLEVHMVFVLLANFMNSRFINRRSLNRESVRWCYLWEIGGAWWRHIAARLKLSSTAMRMEKRRATASQIAIQGVFLSVRNQNSNQNSNQNFNDNNNVKIKRHQLRMKGGQMDIMFLILNLNFIEEKFRTRGENADYCSGWTPCTRRAK